MEDNLKISKAEHPTNHWFNQTQFLNLSLDDQIKAYKCFKWRQLPMEDNLKLLKVEYLNHHWLDYDNILNLS